MHIRTWSVGLIMALSLGVGLGARPVHAGDLILGGQTHEYKVIFRGDGRAIVLGEMAISNTEQEELASMTVNLSVDDAEQMVAYQVFGTRTPYEKMTVTEGEEGVFTFTFPKPLEGNSGGLIRFAYTSREYTKDFLGLKKYTFHTPTVESNIEQVRVYVQTDSDLALVGKNTTIKYGESGNTIDTGKVLDDVALGSSSPTSLDSVLRGHQGNTVSELATGLFPGESFEVKGKYSEFWWRLYLVHALVVAAVLILGFGIFFWKYRGSTRQMLMQCCEKIKRATFGTPAVTGLLAAVALIAWILILTETRLLRILQGGDLSEALSIIVVIMVSVLLGVIPSLYMGIQRGWKSGISTFVWQIIWIIAALAFTGVLSDIR